MTDRKKSSAKLKAAPAKVATTLRNLGTTCQADERPRRSGPQTPAGQTLLGLAVLVVVGLLAILLLMGLASLVSSLSERGGDAIRLFMWLVFAMWAVLGLSCIFLSLKLAIGIAKQRRKEAKRARQEAKKDRVGRGTEAPLAKSKRLAQDFARHPASWPLIVGGGMTVIALEAHMFADELLQLALALATFAGAIWLVRSAGKAVLAANRTLSLFRLGAFALVWLVIAAAIGQTFESPKIDQTAFATLGQINASLLLVGAVATILPNEWRTSLRDSLTWLVMLSATVLTGVFASV